MKPLVPRALAAAVAAAATIAAPTQAGYFGFNETAIGVVT
jgi:hypothetical protein